MPELSKDQLKNYLIEYLKGNPETQFESILQFGIEEKINRGLNGKESRILLELIHEFTVSNMIMPSMNRHNTGWPWLAVTGHGREVLSKAGPPIYDYDGYLDELLKRVKNIDQVVQTYLSESLRAYQYNLYFSSMVMLGCSSERSLRLLIQSYISAIDNPTNQEKLLQRLNGRDISNAYNSFKESFDSTRNQVKATNIVKDFEDHVDGIFNFIRLLRNSIVHPDGIPNVTSALVYANLQQFSYYIETVFKLIDFYSQNKITV